MGKQPIGSGRGIATGANGIAQQPEPLDARVLLSQVDGDFELLASLAALFDEQAGLRVAELLDAIERGDASRLNDAAHALKSMIGIWQQGRAYDLAATLENKGREGTIAGAALDGEQLIEQLHGLHEQIGSLLARENRDEHPDSR